MTIQHKVLECPFCGEETIKAAYTPAAYREVKGPWGPGKSTVKSGDTLDILSGCEKCGQSLKEVKKRLKNPKRDHKKIAERLKNSGLPTVWKQKL